MKKTLLIKFVFTAFLLIGLFNANEQNAFAQGNSNGNNGSTTAITERVEQLETRATNLETAVSNRTGDSTIGGYGAAERPQCRQFCN
jgi:hypothetical protein